MSEMTISLKRLSGEYITIDMSSKDVKDDIDILRKLNKINPLSFPKHRTKIQKSDEKDNEYYLVIDSELFIEFYSSFNNSIYIEQYYCECLECQTQRLSENSKLLYNNYKNEQHNSMVRYMEEKNYDGFVIEEYRGSTIGAFLLPMSIETFYHIYIFEISVIGRYCKIICQKDVNELDEFDIFIRDLKKYLDNEDDKKDELKEICEKIKLDNTKFDYQSFIVSHNGDMMRSSFINKHNSIIIGYEN